MKKIFLLVVLLISFLGYSQDNRPPQSAKRGIDTPFIQLDTLTTTQRDSYVIKPSKTRLIYNKTEDVLQFYSQVSNSWVNVNGVSGGSSSNIATSNLVIPDAIARYLDLGVGGSFAMRDEDYDTFIYLDNDELDIRNADGTIRMRTGTGGTYTANSIGDFWRATSTSGHGEWQTYYALQAADIDTFSELDAIVSDKNIANLDDDQTFTGNQNISSTNASSGTAGLKITHSPSFGGNYALHLETTVNDVIAQFIEVTGNAVATYVNAPSTYTGNVYSYYKDNVLKFQIDDEGNLFTNGVNGVVLDATGASDEFLSRDGVYRNISAGSVEGVTSTGSIAGGDYVGTFGNTSEDTDSFIRINQATGTVEIVANNLSLANGASAEGNKLTNVLAGTDPTDATNLEQVENLIAAANGTGTISRITTTRDLTEADNGSLLRYDSTSDLVVNIPDGLSDNFSVVFDQIGTGKIQIAYSGSETGDIVESLKESTFKSTFSMFNESGVWFAKGNCAVYTPVVPSTNMYNGTDAAGNDSDSIGLWQNVSGTTITSIPSTDTTLGDNYALRLALTLDNDKDITYDVSGLTIGQTYKASIRCRQPQGDVSGWVFSNWDNVTSTTYHTSGIPATWTTAEIFFTPTATTVGLKVYIGQGTNLTGDSVEISEIIINEI